MIQLQAPAKVNLSLEVLGRRSDGFHELVSIMQTVTLSDTLECAPSRSLSLHASDIALQSDNNLALRAAASVKVRYGIEEGCRLRLEKRIPIAAGLGGGSSDAATALVGVCTVWGVPLNCLDLLDMAKDLGSDVPFFLYGGTCLVEGRGEQVTALDAQFRGWYVLANANVAIPTSEIFAALDQSNWGDGSVTRALVNQLRHGGPTAFGINGLQQTCFRLYPEVRACYDAVAALSSGNAILSGSGATVVGLCATENEATAAQLVLRRSGYWCTVAQPLDTGGSWLPCR